MKVVFSKEEQYLLALLKRAMLKENSSEEIDDTQLNISQVISLARKHAVLPFLYDVVQDNPLFQKELASISADSKKTALQSYRLLFLTKYVVNLFQKAGISTIVLKGVATGSLYEVPEQRKSGDVDLLITENVKEQEIIDIMQNAGFGLAKEQHANHHIAFSTNEGISVEVHTMIAEPFAYKKINRAMEKRTKECNVHCEIADVMGVPLPILDKPFHAYELLLHMLQHFMYAGFGLKLLCDWVVIWKKSWTQEEKFLFTELAKECGIDKFAEMITAVCEQYLGLPKNQFAWKLSEDLLVEDFLREILTAEEFGNSDPNRMVMMHGTGIWAYVREFQHQMHLNFPKAGKCFLLWPVLWILTLVKFLKNNRKVRRIKTSGILKEARRRSKLMEQLRLFQ